MHTKFLLCFRKRLAAPKRILSTPIPVTIVDPGGRLTPAITTHRTGRSLGICSSEKHCRMLKDIGYISDIRICLSIVKQLSAVLPTAVGSHLDLFVGIVSDQTHTRLSKHIGS